MNAVALVVGAIGLGLRPPRANRRRLEKGLSRLPPLAEGAEQVGILLWDTPRSRAGSGAEAPIILGMMSHSLGSGNNRPRSGFRPRADADLAASSLIYINAMVAWPERTWTQHHATPVHRALAGNLRC
jgi:hypothetical protein